MKNILLLIIMGSMICSAAWCRAEVKDSSLIGTKKSTEKTSLFLELKHPEPLWVENEKRQRERWLEEKYELDKNRSYKEFTIPSAGTTSLQDFRSDPMQGGEYGPFLQIQCRQRKNILVQKQHTVVATTLWSDKLKTNNELVKVWSVWKWEPDRITRGGAAVIVKVLELDRMPGQINTWKGFLDQDGNLSFSLIPYLDYGIRKSDEGQLTFRFACQKYNTTTDVVVPKNVFQYYRDLMARRLKTLIGEEEEVFSDEDNTVQLRSGPRIRLR